MAQGYESGWLGPPFVGISTFGKCPGQPDRPMIDADLDVRWVPGNSSATIPAAQVVLNTIGRLARHAKG